MNFQKSVLDHDGDFSKADMQETVERSVRLSPGDCEACIGSAADDETRRIPYTACQNGPSGECLTIIQAGPIRVTRPRESSRSSKVMAFT